VFFTYAVWVDLCKEAKAAITRYIQVLYVEGLGSVCVLIVQGFVGFAGAKVGCASTGLHGRIHESGRVFFTCRYVEKAV
jgi:hypothetical protein